MTTKISSEYEYDSIGRISAVKVVERNNVASCGNSIALSLVASDIKLIRELESLTLDVFLFSQHVGDGKFESLNYVEFLDDGMLRQLKATYSSLQITNPVWKLRMRGEQVAEFDGKVTWSPFGLRFSV